ncbi:hypothetical protein [Paenibacillus sacheonensis]|uniref:Uncharacterized protein n=1 Tax=Paenibacillus sacheonensis TaxID=742054 RepID=A0A7X4YRI4_9BACL|nr:hypothetical protein [Paenibacillus sacheonensis]MBM7564983.1 hypothetical protein [Paenibacillus sacheonensis]NBC70229.1 hypothetical protein [Paenibacillus sacheonensis]
MGGPCFSRYVRGARQPPGQARVWQGLEGIAALAAVAMDNAYAVRQLPAVLSTIITRYVMFTLTRKLHDARARSVK